MDKLNFILLNIILVCSFLTINSISPIESLFFLILNFMLGAILYLRLGAEFLALLILIIYIGAIFILFIFVIMMLNLRSIFLYKAMNKILYFIAFIFLFFVSFYFKIFQINLYIYKFQYGIYYFFIKLLNFDNLTLIGSILYNYIYIYFIILGILLFIAMLCVIILVLEEALIFSNLSKIERLILIKKIYVKSIFK